MLAELFAEEDRAREMATSLIAIGSGSNAAAAIAERESVLAFLLGPMERHMVHEEQRIFPQLERHGLVEEVRVALEQHQAIRHVRDKLKAAEPSQVASMLIEAGRTMLHHTNFESDYVYPELTHDQWLALMRETA
jgi:vacuolar-type H+-ATPase subunit F/Vma7